MANTGIVSSAGAPKTGAGNCGTNNLQTPIGYIFLPRNSSIDTDDVSDLVDKIGQELVTLIKSAFSTFEAVNEENPYQEGSVGTRKSARQGKPRDSYTVASNLGVLRQLDGFNASCGSYDVIKILADGRLQGRDYDIENNLLFGYNTSMINVEALSQGTDEAPAARKIIIDYQFPEQINSETSVVDPTYDITEIEGIASVYLALSGSDVVVGYDNGEYKKDVINKVFGLSADFIDADTGLPIAGITETAAGSGIYTGFVAATNVTLALPQDQTDDLRYSASNQVTIP